MSDDQLKTSYTNISKVNLSSSSLKEYKEFLSYFRDLASYEMLLRSEN
ncbi:MAG: hypothetical protein LBD88_00620 [Candidatus Peribacteria bacterium]|nr:hypothetical protein [Candidatus Peribacteria bacterium]